MTAIRACRIRVSYAAVTLMSIPSFHTLHHPQSTSKTNAFAYSTFERKQYMRATVQFICVQWIMADLL